MASIRKRFESALSGERIERPVYAVYDWFVNNRPEIDWEFLFGQGLGQINHANLVKHEHPGFEIVESVAQQDGRLRRDVRLITDRGELHEWYLDEWRQEHFIKTPEDYLIMKRALEGVQVTADDEHFLELETEVGEKGITLGQLQGLDRGRTPLMALQVDWVGLEQFSIDLAYGINELFELLEIMTEIKLEEVRQAVKTPARQIKLWENLSIETLGPDYYRRYLVPLYRKILRIANAADKRILVHYDGQLRIISEDIRELDIDGIDSFTEAPEGDMSVADARSSWPEKFIWQNINLNWYELSDNALKNNLLRAVEEAEFKRHCFMISEDVPQNWRKSVPAILKFLEQI